MTEKFFDNKVLLVDLIGETAVVVFLDGEEMSGTVVDVSVNDIVLMSDQMKASIFIPNHAIKYIYMTASK